MASTSHEAVHRVAIRRGAYPIVLALTLGTSGVLLTEGQPLWVAMWPVVLVSALVVGALEWLAPHTPRWRPSGRSLFVDLVHTLVAAATVVPALRATLFVGAALIGAELSARFGAEIWPTRWPLAAQTVLAVIVADLGAYAAHRFMHLTRVGWRLHAVHHTVERMNFLAASRSHPFNATLTLTMENVPLILLGISPEALALVTVFKAVNGLLQHSNIELDPGVLSHLIATSEVHRWHHSRVLEESNTNFGNTTTIWDRVFGTLFLPGDRRPPLDVGIEGTEIPERYLVHLAAPFTLADYEAPEPTTADAARTDEHVRLPPAPAPE